MGILLLQYFFIYLFFLSSNEAIVELAALCEGGEPHPLVCSLDQLNGHAWRHLSEALKTSSLADIEISHCRIIMDIRGKNLVQLKFHTFQIFDWDNVKEAICAK